MFASLYRRSTSLRNYFSEQSDSATSRSSQITRVRGECSGASNRVAARYSRKDAEKTRSDPVRTTFSAGFIARHFSPDVFFRVSIFFHRARPRARLDTRRGKSSASAVTPAIRVGRLPNVPPLSFASFVNRTRRRQQFSRGTLSSPVRATPNNPRFTWRTRVQRRNHLLRSG